MLALMKLEEDREEAKVSKTTSSPRRRRKQKVRSNSPSCESQDDDRDDEGSNSMSSSDDRGDSSDDQDDVSDESDAERDDGKAGIRFSSRSLLHSSFFRRTRKQEKGKAHKVPTQMVLNCKGGKKWSSSVSSSSNCRSSFVSLLVGTHFPPLGIRDDSSEDRDGVGKEL